MVNNKMSPKARKNEIHLDFLISNFDDTTHDEISELIGFQPTTIHVKGDRRNPNNEHSPLIKNNNWFLASGVDKHENFDAHMDALLSVLESKTDVLQSICSKYHCEFVCAFYIYKGNGESTPWVILSDRYNRLISKLNITFDLDLYVF